MKLDRPLRMLSNLLLRLVDVFVGVYLIRPVRLDEPPFKKANDLDKHHGFFLIAVFPIVLQTGAAFMRWLDSLNPMLLNNGFVVGALFVVPAVLVVVLIVKVSPRIPLRIVLITAAIAYPLVIWLNWPRF